MKRALYFMIRLKMDVTFIFAFINREKEEKNANTCTHLHENVFAAINVYLLVFNFHYFTA